MTFATVRVANGEPGAECQIGFGYLGMLPDPVTGQRPKVRQWENTEYFVLRPEIFDHLNEGEDDMLPLYLAGPSKDRLSVLAIGAHPDDIEIGAGGTLLSISESQPGFSGYYVVLTGTPERQLEARNAAKDFLPGADLTVRLYDLPEGRLPTVWGEVKEILEQVARSYVPDVILAPSRDDAHQDHRIIGEIVPTVFRNQLCLEYEVPKWDGDLGRRSMYCPMSAEAARRKVELLHKCFPSQHSRDWWDGEVFLGLARLRGMECRAPYAEAFTCTKAVIVCKP